MAQRNSLWLILLIGIISCNQKPTDRKEKQRNTPVVVNFDNNSALKKFRELNLDSAYANLLDPRNVTETEHTAVLKSWTAFHENLSSFLDEENFNWDVSDSTIIVVNRIYFDNDGTIDYYAFKILNNSISSEKKSEYEIVLQKFSKHVKLDLQRKEQYAQCGKVKYPNY